MRLLTCDKTIDDEILSAWWWLKFLQFFVSNLENGIGNETYVADDNVGILKQMFHVSLIVVEANM